MGPAPGLLSCRGPAVADPMRVLVTGASGFVGRALCDYLHSDVRLSALVRTAAAVEALRRRGIAATRLDGLTADGEIPAELLDVDVLVHLAAQVHVMAADGAAQAAHERINHQATLNLARQAAAAGVRRLVYLSSIKVNGERTRGVPFSASSPADPQDSYAQSKWRAEQGLLALAHSSGMEVVIIRPPLVYGPGVKANFAQLVRWVRRGVPLPLAGVANRRALVSVFNLCDLIRCCLRHPAAAGQVLLVSDGESISTPTLCRRIAAAAEIKIRLFFVPPWLLSAAAALLGKSAAVARLTEDLEVDISATQQLLQWRPPHGMATTLQKIIESER